MVKRRPKGARLVVFPAYARAICGVGDGDSLRVFVLSMVFFGVDLFVLFEVLGPLERFLAYFANMGFEGSVYCTPGEN